MSGRITEFPSAFPHLRAAIGLQSAGPKGMPSIAFGEIKRRRRTKRK
jgi:hypothetical protein